MCDLPARSEDLLGKVLWQAMNRHCSRSLIAVLQSRRPKAIQTILSEAKDQICVLMFNCFGCDVIQSLLQVCDEQQMNQLVSSVTSNVSLLKAVCLHSQGSKSMEKFVECLSTPEQIHSIITVFSSFAVPLVKCRFGCRLFRHCFNIFPTELTNPLFDVIADNFLEISTNEYGYTFLSQVLKSKAFLLECRPRVLSEIIANVCHLAHDRFGCYVLSSVINLRLEDVVGEIVARLTGHFASLSIRHSQIVVSTLMWEYKEEYTPQIVNELISSPDFSRILLDPCGKIVFKLARKYTKGTIRKKLNHQISLHSDHMHSHRHGKSMLPKRKR